MKSHIIYLEHFNVKVQSKDEPGISLSLFSATDLLGESEDYTNYAPPPQTMPDRDFLFWEQSLDQVGVVPSTTLLFT